MAGKIKRPKIEFEDFIYRVGKLSLGPHDIVIVRTELMLDKDQTRHLQNIIEENLARFGVTNKVMILTAGLDVMVLEQEDASPNS